MSFNFCGVIKCECGREQAVRMDDEQFDDLPGVTFDEARAVGWTFMMRPPKYGDPEPVCPFCSKTERQLYFTRALLGAPFSILGAALYLLGVWITHGWHSAKYQAARFL